MEHVKGKVFKNPLLPDCTPEERKVIYSRMAEVLAKIHKVSIEKAELTDFGKVGEKKLLKLFSYILLILELWLITVMLCDDAVNSLNFEKFNLAF